MFLGFIDILRFKIQYYKGEKIEEGPMTREACKTKDEVDKNFEKG